MDGGLSNNPLPTVIQTGPQKRKAEEEPAKKTEEKGHVGIVVTSERRSRFQKAEQESSLGKVFTDLDWYGREMRVKHGPGTRRNIKFDDAEETMYVDVCLPEESYWHRIPHSEAAQYREKIMSERARASRISLEKGPQSRAIGPNVPDVNRIPLGQNRRNPSVNDASGRTTSPRQTMGWGREWVRQPDETRIGRVDRSY